MHLSTLAAHRWRDKCPCCGVRMTGGRYIAGRVAPPTYKTRGHDKAIAEGGSLNLWVWICNRCNVNQASLSFEVWARKLMRADDARAERVAELADFFRRHESDSRHSYPGVRPAENVEVPRIDTLAD